MKSPSTTVAVAAASIKTPSNRQGWAHRLKMPFPTSKVEVPGAAEDATDDVVADVTALHVGCHTHKGEGAFKALSKSQGFLVASFTSRPTTHRSCIDG
jgi:hypothetical protein